MLPRKTLTLYIDKTRQTRLGVLPLRGIFITNTLVCSTSLAFGILISKSKHRALKACLLWLTDCTTTMLA